MNSLIIEEDIHNKELLVELLEEVTDYKFIAVSSKFEALKLLETQDFKLILIDYWSCNFKIQDVLDKIDISKSKVIILTTLNNGEELENEYKTKTIHKPYDIDDLVTNFS